MTLPQDSSRLPVAGSRNANSNFSGNRQLATGNWLRRFTKVVAFSTSRSFLSLRERKIDHAPVAATIALVAIVYLQIIAGALMRHLGAGLAIPDFPLSFGHLVPAFTSSAIAANFAHRVGALLVTIAIIVAISQAFRLKELRKLAIGLIAVVALQIFLGAEV